MPLKDLVANFVNSLESISGSIPTPVSLIQTRISLAISSFSTLTHISPTQKVIMAVVGSLFSAEDDFIASIILNPEVCLNAVAIFEKQL